jgi:uncharacterized RDD family membrane protein YckC
MSTEFSAPGTTAPAPPAASAGSGPRAGFFARLAALLIDELLIGVPLGILVALIPDAAAALYVLWLVANAGYFVYFEGGPTGQTVGKKALGIRVYDLQQGGPIGHGRAFIRWIGRIVSGFVIYLGYLWALWDPQKQTWHDKMAGSVVVPASDYPV